VYRVLDDEAVKHKHGHFTRADCERLWQSDTWADMHPELLALMQRFELCYQLPNIQPETWFSPQLLPPNKPTALLDWNQSGDLIMHFRYEFMPKGIISRLMVRQHHLIGAGKDAAADTDKHACLTCVLFQHKTSSASAELLPSGSEIALRARGPDRKVLLTVLANELEAINQGFSGLTKKVEKRISCQCTECKKKLDPVFFDESDLIRRIKNNRHEVECNLSYEMLNVQKLLDGVDAGDSANLPAWAHKPPAPKIIRIFLASSEELLKDRDAFELHFRRQNDHRMESGIELDIVRWENFSNAMSATRKQDDYNQVLQECDIFLSLFATKAGKYTEEEFDAAFAQFKATGSPQIFTFFRDTPTSTASLVRKDAESLWKMQDKLKELGHFYTHYHDENDLNLQFSTQLTKMRQANKLKIS
jgi:internalin A